MKKLLTIAGSDSSGGAGIQADLKTFSALGAYGMSCITALTAQNTKGVTAVMNADPPMVTAQLEAVYDDIPPDAVKTGMLSTAPIVTAVSDFLAAHKGAPLVVDPVMVSTSGSILLEEDAVAAVREALIPLAALITPNMPEAAVLTGHPVETASDMRNAAKALMDLGCAAVLVKGGHRKDDAMDVLYDGRELWEFPASKIDTKNTHGTGCTLSSALAVMLARGLSLPEAVGEAKRYLTGAIEGASHDEVGHGHGPVRHFWQYPDWGKP